MSIFDDIYDAKSGTIEGEIIGSRGDDVFDIVADGVPNNKVQLDRGDDYFSVTSGEHIIEGDRGDDTIMSGEGSDLLSGGRGDDLLYGQEGDDFVFGNRGDDQLHGGADNDYLHGGRGEDVLRGDTGDDTLVGGRGEDIFVHAAGDNLTVVHDFEKGKDKIQLEFDGVDDLETVLAVAQDVQVTEESITVVVDDNNTLMVYGVGTDNPLDASDFLFA